MYWEVALTHCWVLTACRQSYYLACHTCCLVLFQQHVATLLHLALSGSPSTWHAGLTAKLLGLACAGFPVYWDVALTANSSQRELQYLKDGAFLDVASSGMRMLLMTYSAVLDAFGCVLHVAQLSQQVALGTALISTGHSVSQVCPTEMVFSSSAVRNSRDSAFACRLREHFAPDKDMGSASTG